MGNPDVGWAVAVDGRAVAAEGRAVAVEGLAVAADGRAVGAAVRLSVHEKVKLFAMDPKVVAYI